MGKKVEVIGGEVYDWPKLFKEELADYRKPFPVCIIRSTQIDSFNGATGICLGLYAYSQHFKSLTELKKITNWKQLDKGDSDPLIYVPCYSTYAWRILNDYKDLVNPTKEQLDLVGRVEASLTEGKDPFLDKAFVSELKKAFNKIELPRTKQGAIII